MDGCLLGWSKQDDYDFVFDALVVRSVARVRCSVFSDFGHEKQKELACGPLKKFLSFR